MTLRFKQHKTTILLLVAQSQPFTSIKEDLLAAIKATGIEDIDGVPIPSNPESIVLGLPVDKNDISKGWVPLKIPEAESGDKKGKGVKKGSILNENPLGAELKDGALLAFKFTDGGNEDQVDADFDVVMPTVEEDASSP